MKFLTLILLTLSIQAQAADQYVARYSFHAGFSPNPQTITADIHRNGLVTYEVHTMRSNRTVTQKIAVLAPDQVRKLVKAASQIKATDLVDPDAGKPMCTDAPSSAILVLDAAGQAVAIYSRRGCHTFSMPESAAAQLIVAVVSGLTALGSASN